MRVALKPKYVFQISNFLYQIIASDNPFVVSRQFIICPPWAIYKLNYIEFLFVY